MFFLFTKQTADGSKETGIGFSCRTALNISRRRFILQSSLIGSFTTLRFVSAFTALISASESFIGSIKIVFINTVDLVFFFSKRKFFYYYYSYQNHCNHRLGRSHIVPDSHIHQLHGDDGDGRSHFRTRHNRRDNRICFRYKIFMKWINTNTLIVQ